MQSELPPAALRLEIDRDALGSNWRVLNELSGKAHAAAAVKADAYGVGVKQVVPALLEAGCKDFLVAHWSEVSDLIGLTDPSQTSVLHGPLTPLDAAYAQALGVKPVINSPIQARIWLEAGGGPCDVMVDTGINRLGVEMKDISDEALRALDIDVLMSHLACADEDVPLNAIQQQRWVEARRALPHQRASLANSAGIVLGPDYHGDLTRPGLSLYGGIPRRELEGKIRQVARPQASIMQVRKIESGDGVGYNSLFVADRPMRVGSIALGYADGYLRCWTGKGLFHAKGKTLPSLGRVSMDMTVIDLTDAPDLKEGDWVEAQYSLPQAAQATELSQYELLTLLAERFAR